MGVDKEKARLCGPGLLVMAGAQTKTGCIRCNVELLSKDYADRRKCVVIGISGTAAIGKLRRWMTGALPLNPSSYPKMPTAAAASANAKARLTNTMAGERICSRVC